MTTQDSKDWLYETLMDCYHSGSLSQAGKTIHPGTVKEWQDKIERHYKDHIPQHKWLKLVAENANLKQQATVHAKELEKAVQAAEEITADIEFKAGINHVTMSGEWVQKDELEKAIRAATLKQRFGGFSDSGLQEFIFDLEDEQRRRGIAQLNKESVNASATTHRM